MTKIVFYGTGEFAATVLKNIAASGSYQILCVITQPDRPAGRNFENQKSAVKILAENLNIPVLQPDSLKNFENPAIRQADLGVVAEYGMIIPEPLLYMPTHKTLNLHGSILPKYRGASPIQTAILMGDKQTGVTLMLMDKKMDHGPTLASASIPVGDDETYKELSARLAEIAAELFLNKAPRYIAGGIAPAAQNDNQATFCKILTRDDGRIDFKKNAAEIYNQFRALTPWPGTWALLSGKRCKLTGMAKAPEMDIKPGEIITDNERIFAGCGDNTAIEILSLQLEGKKNLAAAAFINGMRSLSGKIFE